MIALLALIVLAAAQECPYCRYDKCTLSAGSHASCSECHTGALVYYKLFEPSSCESTFLGICQLCPDNCGACEYAVVSQLPILNCTSCASGFVNNPANGKCDPASTRLLNEATPSQNEVTEGSTTAYGANFKSSLGVLGGLISGTILCYLVFFLSLYVFRRSQKITEAPNTVPSGQQLSA